MNNTFEITGLLTMGKESEKFKPYTTTTSAKGWTTEVFQPTLVAGCNRHFTRIKGFHKADGTGKVFTFSKSGIDTDTLEKIKGEKLQIAWEDRNKPELVEQVAEFKKFVVDLEEPNRRYHLEKALEKVQDGSITEQEVIDLNLEETDKIISAALGRAKGNKATKTKVDLLEIEILEKELISLKDGSATEADLGQLRLKCIEISLVESKRKRKEFIHESDFINLVKKIIESGKFSNRLFKTMGEIQHTEYQGKFRENMVPSRIYLAAEDAVPSSIGNITIFFKEDAVTETKDGYLINGYVRNYDNDRKEEIGAPIELWLDTANDDTDVKREKLHKLLVSQFTVVDESYKEIGCKVHILDGSQKVDITEDMLNDFQKEMIELGCMTFDDVRAELGGDLYGDKVKKMVVDTVAKGYTKGRKDTLYKDSDFVVKAIQLKEDPKPSDKIDDSSEDIFEGLY